MVNLAGAADWKGVDKDGHRKAPPLNGTGHTWHHNDELLHKIIKTLDDNNALIIRMNTEKISYPENTQYISRFAISIRDENAPECLAQIVKVAGEMKLTFRYETS